MFGGSIHKVRPLYFICWCLHWNWCTQKHKHIPMPVPIRHSSRSSVENGARKKGVKTQGWSSKNDNIWNVKQNRHNTLYFHIRFGAFCGRYDRISLLLFCSAAFSGLSICRNEAKRQNETGPTSEHNKYIMWVIPSPCCRIAEAICPIVLSRLR